MACSSMTGHEEQLPAEGSRRGSVLLAIRSRVCTIQVSFSSTTSQMSLDCHFIPKRVRVMQSRSSRISEMHPGTPESNHS